MVAFDEIPRFSLAFLPTPLHSLARLSAELGGPEIWIKRDDQTGLAGGGNKARKLETLVADALAAGADTLITTGAAQSNHCRQTAAAAARAGLQCELVLTGERPEQLTGNLLLDDLMGARIHWADRQERDARLMELERDLREAARQPYRIPYGGSDPVGAAAYAIALEELRLQAAGAGLTFDAVVVASSSGGTQAGMVVGARELGWPIPIIGVSIDEDARALSAIVASLATRTAQRWGIRHTIEPGEILVEDGFLGRGYGVVGDLERRAIRRLARAEGLILDPVYTGRAFGGLLDLLERGRFGAARRVLFWHTGGTPALFAYASDLRRGEDGV
jgi:D-cysteine desulfhydrase